MNIITFNNTTSTNLNKMTYSRLITERFIARVMPILLVTLGFLNAEALDFASDSKLANGRWVKIGISKSGVYEIPYNRLKILGFDNPTTVAIYGTGGNEIPLDFINTSGESFVADDLQPVAISHRNDRIIFYAQGPDHLQWTKDEAMPGGGYYTNTGLNFYSDYGYYFISDSSPVKSPTIKSGLPGDTEVEDANNIWAFAYHEKDLSLGLNESGKELFGESFSDPQKRTQVFPCKLKGLDLSGNKKGVVSLKFATDSKQYSTVKLSGTNLSSSCTFGIPSAGGEITYNTNAQLKYAVGLKSSLAEPSVTISFDTEASTVRMAALDYYLITYPRLSALDEDEDQYVATVTEGNVRIPSQIGTETWDITDMANPILLPPGNGYVVIPEGDRRIIRFASIGHLPQPETYKLVNNSNLHRLATDNDPDLLIISTEKLYQNALEYADYHNAKGEKTMAVKIADLYNEFSSGRPDPMAYRLFIKMLYDKETDNPLKAVLLFGDIRGKIKNIDNEDIIIALQSESGAKTVETHNLIDVYGMTDSYYSGNIKTRPIRVPVAVLPFKSEEEAKQYLEKVKKYETDESIPYWIDKFLYLADDNNKGLHVVSIEYLISSLNEAAADKNSTFKNYLGEAPINIVSDNFFNYLNNGCGYILYMGHGNSQGIGSKEFLRTSNISRMDNNRYPFMIFGGCSTTFYEILKRGVSESMAIGSDKGLIGTLATVREVWAQDNQNFIEHFNNALFRKVNEKDGRNPAIAEAFKYAKSKESTANKFNFNLICDPLLRLPFPSMISAAQNTDTEIIPGKDFLMEGEIQNPDGSLAQDFNGTIVVKYYAPAYRRKLANMISGYVTDATVKYDQDIIATQAINVTAGKFSEKLRCPDYISRYAGHEISCTLTAFDPNTRLVSFGRILKTVGGNGSKPSPDASVPVIQTVKVEDKDPMHASANTTLYIYATDKNGIRTDLDSPESSMYVALDGQRISKLSSMISVADGGKILELRIPLSELDPGIHEAEVYITGYNGNSARSTYTFCVASDRIAPLALKGECREMAEFTYPAEASGAQLTLLILTHDGKIVARRNVTEGDPWDLKDDEGKRVSPGLYKAVILKEDRVSSPLNVPVLAEN